MTSGMFASPIRWATSSRLILLVKDGGWDEMCSLLRYLAFQDVGGLATIVAGHRVGAVCDQVAPHPGPPPVERPTGAPLDTAPAPAVCTPAVGAGRPPSVMGGPAAVLPTGDGGRPLAGPPVRAPFGVPPLRRDYRDGVFRIVRERSAGLARLARVAC